MEGGAFRKAPSERSGEGDALSGEAPAACGDGPQPTYVPIRTGLGRGGLGGSSGPSASGSHSGLRLGRHNQPQCPVDGSTGPAWLPGVPQYADVIARVSDDIQHVGMGPARGAAAGREPLVDATEDRVDGGPRLPARPANAHRLVSSTTGAHLRHRTRKPLP